MRLTAGAAPLALLAAAVSSCHLIAELLNERLYGEALLGCLLAAEQTVALLNMAARLPLACLSAAARGAWLLAAPSAL